MRPDFKTVSLRHCISASLWEAQHWTGKGKPSATARLPARKLTSRMLCARALPAAASSAKTTYAWELPRVAAMAPLSTAALRGIFFSRSTGTDRSRTDTILPYLRRQGRGRPRVEVHPAGPGQASARQRANE